MNAPLRTPLFVIACALGGHTLDAQGDPVAVTRSATALTERGNGLEAHGPGYKATLDRDGVTFVPALGTRAPRNLPVRFVPVSIRRGSDTLWNGARTAPRLESTTAVYDRAPGTTERWRVRPDGIELRYRFDQLLSGRGDLVVRLAVHTELRAPASGAEAPVRFTAPDLGGVRVGGVTGIDAAGRTTPGELRFDRGHLELVLSAAFVDGASYPLVLDPLIGPEVAVGATTGDDSAPAAAYDAANDLYLVCWQEEFSGADVDIRAQLVWPTGGLVGPLLPLAPNGSVSIEPTVASVAASEAFFVAWQDGPTLFGPWDIHGANVAAKPYTGFATAALVTSTRSEVEPDTASVASSDALLVWRENGADLIGSLVTCARGAASTPPPVMQPKLLLGAPMGSTHLALSQNGGAAQRHVAVWNAGALGIQARCFDAALNPLGAVHQVVPPALSEDEPDVDGDGTDFLVVWHQNEPASPNRRDVFAQKVRYDPVSQALSNAGAAVPVANDAAQDERTPAVGFVGPKTLVAWSEERLPAALFQYDVAVRALDPTNCRACGPEETLGMTGSAFNHDPQIATMAATGSAEDEAWIVFASALDRPPFTSEVFGRSYEAIGLGGRVQPVSAPCGEGGTAGVSGAMALGNSSFAYTLRGAQASALVGVFVLNAAGPTFPCGPCKLTVPLVSVGVPLASGRATVPSRIDCEISWVGVTIETQWWVLGTTTSPCFVPGLSFSSRLHSTIGF